MQKSARTQRWIRAALAVWVACCVVRAAAAAPAARQHKALGLLGFYPPAFGSDLDYDGEDEEVAFEGAPGEEEEELSRALPPTRRRPSHRKKTPPRRDYSADSLNSLQYENSPIFYIRLPPTPYVFVPGLGYVSQPPTLGPPPPPAAPLDPFINVPVDFVSNGKPTNVYRWPEPYAPPAPPRPPPPAPAKVTKLKGPYVFNGKPSDSVFVLRDSYNSLYSDALQNFYP